MHEKLLIIRFGSIGDIIQGLGIPQAFRSKFPQAQVHWIVKHEFSFLVEHHPMINNVSSFERQTGLWGLLRLAWRLRAENFTHIYDAHDNLRSRLVSFILTLFRSPHFLRRPKERWKRFLYFKLGRRGEYLMPFRGQYSYLRPLARWLGKTFVPPAPQLYFPEATLEFVLRKIHVPKPFIALVPSAAWTMKRWPQEHWKILIESLPQQSFVILGGPQDQFCDKYQQIDPNRVQNLAGKLTLIESCAALKAASLTISADTGLLHAADQLGAPAIALIGPTAFGYPTRPTSHIMEVQNLPCKPCSKDGSGRCQQTTFRRCMVEVSPGAVAKKAMEILNQQARS